MAIQLILVKTTGLGSSLQFFLAGLSGTGNSYPAGIGKDASGNMYTMGYTDAVGGDDGIVAKYNTSGVLQWQKAIDTGLTIWVEGGYTDSSGNSYIVGRDANLGFVVKIDSSGAIVWQRVYGSITTFAKAVVTDASGNVIVVGYTNAAGEGGDDGFIAKYNSSGTLQWQRIVGTASSDALNAVTTDSSGNIYVAGQTIVSNFGTLIMKYNSSGVLQWQRTIDGASGTDLGFGIGVDSSGNVFVGGQTQSEGLGTRSAHLVKYNSSGTLQWQKLLSTTGFDQWNDVTVDSSDRVFATGRAGTGQIGSNDLLIAEYNNSTGAVVWQNVLGTAGSEYGYNVAADGAGSLTILGTYNNGSYDDLLTLKVPDDGTGTGTYGIFTYQTATLTENTATLTFAVGTLVDTAGSLSDVAGSFTISNASMTNTVYS